jgi:hypothetical protein
MFGLQILREHLTKLTVIIHEQYAPFASGRQFG